MQTAVRNNAIQVAQGKGGEVFCYCCGLFADNLPLNWFLCFLYSAKPGTKSKGKNFRMCCSQWNSLWISPFFKTTCCENSKGRSLAGFFVKFGTKPILPNKEKKQEQQHPKLCSQAWRLVWEQAWRPGFQALHVLWHLPVPLFQLYWSA